MNRFVAFLAILAIYITGTLTSPTGSEADPIDINCEWAEWGSCNDIKCGIGRQVFKIFN